MSAVLRVLCLVSLALACDMKTGSEPETQSPGRKRTTSAKKPKSSGRDSDPAVVQAAAELQREQSLHLRLTGGADAADVRAAVLRRGDGRIGGDRVHVEAGGEPGAEVRYEFFVPSEPAGSSEPAVSEAPAP